MGGVEKSAITYNDIKLVEANRKGKDYLIGDLHGNSAVLEATLNKLKPNDRLILLGDLTDRGKDSPGVIKKINQVNQARPGTILAIRGNHEKLVLNNIASLKTMVDHIGSLKSLEELKSFTEELKKESIDTVSKKYGDAALKIRSHLRNGGNWLVMLFAKELAENKIIIDEKTREISYTENSDIRLIKQYMESLPYIFHVNGAPGIIPYQTVHADMPLSESDIITRANERKALTEEEKEYAIWAREKSTADIIITDKGRTATSTIAFVGHNIVDNEETSPLRMDTNTVDLDIASYKNNIAALFCITDGTCEYVGEGAAEAMNDPRLRQILEIYQQKGLEIQLLNKMSLELSACSSPKEIREVLKATANRFETHATLRPDFKHTYQSLYEYVMKNEMITYDDFIALARLQALDKIEDTKQKDKASLPVVLAACAQALGEDIKTLVNYAVKEEVLTPHEAAKCLFTQPGRGVASKFFAAPKEAKPDIPEIQPISPRKSG